MCRSLRCYQKTLMRLVWSFGIDITYKFGQIGVSQHLPDCHVLAVVIPVVVDEALQERTGGVEDMRIIFIGEAHFLELLSSESVQERIDQFRHSMPGFQRLGKRRSAGRLAIAGSFVEVGPWRLSLDVGQPAALLVAGQVADVPTDAVHRQQTAARIGSAKSFEAALKFSASKA